MHFITDFDWLVLSGTWQDIAYKMQNFTEHMLVKELERTVIADYSARGFSDSRYEYFHYKSQLAWRR